MEDKIYRGDVVWAKNPLASGHIQKNMRPYLIISNNKNNEHSTTVLAIPLTTKIKKNLPTHYKIILNNKVNTVLAEQIVCLNKTDIDSYIDTVNEYDLKQIGDKVKIQLDLKGEMK